MLKLLRADLYRIRKDKLVLIGFILAAGLSLLLCALYALMNSLLESLLVSVPEETAVLTAGFYDGRAVFASSLSMTNNFGIVVPVFAGVLACKEFSFGTVRTKIITGVPKGRIYMSMLLGSTVFSLVLFLAYALMNLFFGCLFLGYGRAFTMAELGYIAEVLLAGAAAFAQAAALSVLIANLSRNMGLTIVMQIVLAFVMSLLATIPSFAGIPDWVTQAARFLPAYQTMEIAAGAAESSACYITVGTNLAYFGLLGLLGVWSFRKKDNK